MSTACIGLGANLDTPGAQILAAVDRLRNHQSISSVVVSDLIDTTPAGGPSGQPRYTNAAAVIETHLNPFELLQTCQEIENELGRKRLERWGPRVIDLDVLLFEGWCFGSLGDPFGIPHPRMRWRRFVLEPLAQVAPHFVHGWCDQTVLEMLAHINRRPWTVAVTGLIGIDGITMLEELQDACPNDWQVIDADPVQDRELIPTLAVWTDNPTVLVDHIRQRQGVDLDSSITEKDIPRLKAQFDAFYGGERAYPVLKTTDPTEVIVAMQSIMP